MVGYRGSNTKHSKGKNPYIDRREFKSKEIKKSLTHRARLRKNYFKLLEKEGQLESKDQKESDEASGDDNKEEPIEKEKQKKKPLNFAERAKKAKERKEKKRQDTLKAIQEKRKLLERKGKEREKKKERISQRTKTGQPLMGPRINNLLDKIKKDIQQ